MINRESIPQLLNTQYTEGAEDNHDGIMRDIAQRFEVLALDKYVDDRMDLDPPYSNLDSAENEPHQVYTASSLVSTLCERLIHEVTIVKFAAALGSIAMPWYRLLRDTAVPDDARRQDSRFIRAFKALDLAIEFPDSGCGLLPRLAIIKLFQLIKTLEARVAGDRKARCIASRRGYRDASITLDIYANA